MYNTSKKLNNFRRVRLPGVRVYDYYQQPRVLPTANTNYNIMCIIYKCRYVHVRRENRFVYKNTLYAPDHKTQRDGPARAISRLAQKTGHIL